VATLPVVPIAGRVRRSEGAHPVDGSAAVYVDQLVAAICAPRCSRTG
jgi:hypothetical protein